MKTYIILLIILITAGCASRPDYSPANGSGSGYSETKITDERYQVQYKTHNDNVMKATNYALLRAAELTSQQGYEWFVITSRENVVDNERIQPRSSMQYKRHYTQTRSCGLLGCTTQTHPSHETGFGVEFTSERDEVKIILEVKMSKEKPSNDDSYNAADVIKNLKPATTS